MAAAMICIDPTLMSGIVVRSHAGPVRDKWMHLVRSWMPKQFPVVQLPLNVSEDRLLGGLDLAATLHTGRPVVEKGLLVRANGGVIVLSMAERCNSTVIACLGTALDNNEVRVERDGISANDKTKFSVIAFDESESHETPSSALLDRIAIHLDMHQISLRDSNSSSVAKPAIDRARELFPAIKSSNENIDMLCKIAQSFGIDSIRACLHAEKVARLIAALHQHTQPDDADLTMAAQLVLAPRARVLPVDQPTQEEPSDQQENEAQSQEHADDENSAGEPDTSNIEDFDDLVLEAAQAAIPNDVLQFLNANNRIRLQSRTSGKSGELQKSRSRGRPIGDRHGKLEQGNRLNLLATLRAAAPWQTIRRRETRSQQDTAIIIRQNDFRITQFKQKSETTTIFVVDASGSSALHRLAEVKGAVELVLSECYIRRDQVALIAFRGTKAELILPPTRSLVRAKRSLANLPGGGGTPLAAGIDSAIRLALQIKQQGKTPTVVLLTDGQANVARDGSPGREKAFADAIASAKMASFSNINSLVIDTSPRSHENAKKIATEMNALYLPLPYADASALSNIVQTNLQANSSAAV